MNKPLLFEEGELVWRPAEFSMTIDGSHSNNMMELITKILSDRPKNDKLDNLDPFCYSMANLVFKRAKMDQIRKVIFNDPATIVFWFDGTKTVVKADNEPFDPEKGLAMAISKKFFGNQGWYYDMFKKWVPQNCDDCDIHTKNNCKGCVLKTKDVKKNE